MSYNSHSTHRTHSPYNLKTFMGSNTIYAEIDKEEKKFYTLIKERGIEPKNNTDYKSLEKIERFLSNMIKNLKELLDNSEFEQELKNLIKSRLIIDSYCIFAEKYGFHQQTIASLFGKSHERELAKALEYIKKVQ